VRGERVHVVLEEGRGLIRESFFFKAVLHLVGVGEVSTRLLG